MQHPSLTLLPLLRARAGSKPIMLPDSDTAATDSAATSESAPNTAPECSGAASADGPGLSARTVEMLDSPQIGAIIYFEIEVMGNVEAMEGGSLFIELMSGQQPVFSTTADVRADPSDSDVLLLNGAPYFGIADIELDGSYQYCLQATDRAGTVGAALAGDVPPDAGD